MPMKFKGTYKELQRILDNTGIDGYWTAVHAGKPVSKYVFKSKDGGIINWWPKTETVQTQGKTDARAVLDATLEPFVSFEDTPSSD